MGVISNIDSKNLGIAGGILALARNTGMIMGIAIGINILEIFQNHYTTTGTPAAFLTAYQHTALILAGFATICTLFARLAYKDEIPPSKNS